MKKIILLLVMFICSAILGIACSKKEPSQLNMVGYDLANYPFTFDRRSSKWFCPVRSLRGRCISNGQHGRYATLECTLDGRTSQGEYVIRMMLIPSGIGRNPTYLGTIAAIQQGDIIYYRYIHHDNM